MLFVGTVYQIEDAGPIYSRPRIDWPNIRNPVEAWRLENHNHGSIAPIIFHPAL
jgi:hypothetical protein